VSVAGLKSPLVHNRSSAGVIPPPPTPKEAFKIATENSFDYSAFIFVGITSAMSE